MKDNLKETVKNIFAANSFETALELTSSLAIPYMDKYGKKSWNSVILYWKKKSEKQVTVLAEPQEEYRATTTEEDADATPIDNEIKDNNEDAINEIATEETLVDSQEIDTNENETTREFSYIVYRNADGDLKWFGHAPNLTFNGVGERTMAVRMNNKGVSEVIVEATATITLEHINLFHQYYGAIVKTVLPWMQQLELAKIALNHIIEVEQDFKRVPKRDLEFIQYLKSFERTNGVI